MEKRMFRNSKGDLESCAVDCTRTKLIVWQKGKIIAKAGVENPKDFDKDVLFRIAVHGIGRVDYAE